MYFGGTPCQDTFSRHEVSIDTPEQNQPKVKMMELGSEKGSKAMQFFSANT